MFESHPYVGRSHRYVQQPMSLTYRIYTNKRFWIQENSQKVRQTIQVNRNSFYVDITGYRLQQIPLRKVWLITQQNLPLYQMRMLVICPSRCLHRHNSHRRNLSHRFNDDIVFPRRENLFGLPSQATNLSLPRKMNIFFIKLDKLSPFSPNVDVSCIESMPLRQLQISKRLMFLRK